MTKKRNIVDKNELYNYLVQEHGLSPNHAVGMLANVQAESSFNSGAVGDGGTSGGLFQLHDSKWGKRFSDMKKDLGEEWKADWKGQVDHIMDTAITKKYLNKEFITPQEASKDFTVNWEIPANKHEKAISRAEWIPTLVKELKIVPKNDLVDQATKDIDSMATTAPAYLPEEIHKRKALSKLRAIKRLQDNENMEPTPEALVSQQDEVQVQELLDEHQSAPKKDSNLVDFLFPTAQAAEADPTKPLPPYKPAIETPNSTFQDSDTIPPVTPVEVEDTVPAVNNTFREEDTYPVRRNQDTYTAAETFANQAGQSLLFNMLDEIKAGLKTSEEMGQSKLLAFMPQEMVAAFSSMTPDQLDEYTKLYTKYRDAERVAMELQMKQHPVAGIAGTIAGLVPQMLLPFGVARGGGALLGQVGKVAAIEGAMGAAYGAGEAREMSDVPAEALKVGAIGGVFGGATPVIARGFGIIKGKVGKVIAEDVMGYIRGSGQRVTERAAERLVANADAERLLQRTSLNRRNAQHIGDPVEWARRADTEDINELASRIPVEDELLDASWASKAVRAHDVAMANRVEFAKFVGRGKWNRLSDKKALAELDSWIAREGQEHSRVIWDQFREYKTVHSLIDDDIVNKVKDMPGGWVPPWARRAAMFMTDARYAFNAIDRRWGTTLGRTLDELAESYNRSNIIREASLNKLRGIRKDVRKTSVMEQDTYRFMRGDQQFEETAPKMYLALDHPEYLAKLSAEEQAKVAKMASHYEALRADTNRLGMPISKIENYVPHFTKSTPDFIRAVKGRADELGIRTGDDAVYTEAGWSRIVDALDEEGRRKFSELKTALRMISDEKLETAQGIRNALAQVNDVKFTHVRLETRAAQAFKRTNRYIPTFIREVDPVLLADRWANQVYKHLFMREGLAEARTAARWMREAGDVNAANYIDNWLADISGTRVNTVAGSARAAVQTVQLKLDDLIKNANNPVSTSFYRGIKQIPDLLELTSGVVYSNLLGFNPRVIVRNLTQPYFMTASEIGGTYGQKLALKAQFDVLPIYMSKNYTSTRAIDRMGLLDAGIAPAKWTGEAIGVLEQSMSHSLPAAAVRKYSRTAMWLYEKSDFHNRMVTFKMAQRLGNDMADGIRKMASSAELTANEAAALKFARRLDPSARTKLRMLIKGNDLEGINKLLSSHLNGSTQFHYNRIALSEYGRFMGTMFSMFTKWPLSISGNMGDIILEQGMSEGMRRIGSKYLGPLLLAGMFDKLVLPDPRESDVTKLLIGSSGLRGWSPAQSAVAFGTGKFVTPPMVDAAVRAITVTASGNPEQFANWLNQSARYWAPGMGLMKLLYEDIPTLETGENPKTVTNWLYKLSGE